MSQSVNQELIEFLDNSPTCFQAVENLKNMLKKEGFGELLECEKWEIVPGGKYFVTRNDSSIIAFSVPKKDFTGFQLICSHTDSPSFKLKENAEMDADGKYTKLNVEGYGGMLCAPWFDRPLSVAGRIAVRTEKGIETRLVNLDQDLAMIPNLAVHMNREANSGYKYNLQKDMLPVVGEASSKGKLMKLVAENAGVKEEDILSTDLFLYNRAKGTIWGLEKEFLSAGRLDDLQCAFASMKGFLAAVPGESVPVCAVFDNEEVGSSTKQGAASTFMESTLRRLNGALGRTEEEYLSAVAGSFMISADNAHAVHPNHTDLADPTNRPAMNGGIVIKYNANQKYTTDAVSAAVFKLLCERINVPYQTFANRSDMAGGSTLGNIANTKVSLNTVDIGLPQLAMHSPYETAGTKDTGYFCEVAKEFFSSSVEMKGNGIYEIRQ